MSVLPNITCPFCERRVSITATGKIHLHANEYGRRPCGGSGLSPDGARIYLEKVTYAALRQNTLRN